MAIQLADKTDFKSKKLTRDKGHYISTKGSIQQKVTIKIIYTSNKRLSKYTKQKLKELKGEIILQ